MSRSCSTDSVCGGKMKPRLHVLTARMTAMTHLRDQSQAREIRIRMLMRHDITSHICRLTALAPLSPMLQLKRHQACDSLQPDPTWLGDRIEFSPPPRVGASMGDAVTLLPPPPADCVTPRTRAARARMRAGGSDGRLDRRVGGEGQVGDKRHR